MLRYFEGCPEILVPDNLRSGVDAPCRYDPDINRTYAEFAAFHGAVVIPARVRRPRDKAKVEAAVLFAERWILAALRHRTFFSLAELNLAIRELLRRLNDRPMRRLGVSRRELFERLDRPALRPLPEYRYELAEWATCRPNIDYHVEFDRNYYSVPHQLARKEVEVRATASTLEVLFKSNRVASHPRQRGRGQYATRPEHMPRSHRAHAEWTPSRLIAWADRSGPATSRLVAAIMESRPHPEQGFRACLGVMRLGKSYGSKRLEAACAKALKLGSYRYKTVHNILRNRMDRAPLDDGLRTSTPRSIHDNVRGALYYAAKEDDLC
jgi:transposase